MRLYHRWKCPWCAAARQGIENSGLEVVLVEVPYPREERTELVEVSGQPRVPVLVDDGEVVVGSQQIVRYVYAKSEDPFFERSIRELDEDIAADQEGGTCELPRP